MYNDCVLNFMSFYNCHFKTVTCHLKGGTTERSESWINLA